MRTIFAIVYEALKLVSSITAFTYNEINIIVYYIITPMVFFVMIDRILNKHILKIGYSIMVLVTIALVDFEKFSDRLFDASARFLLSFQGIGWNYVAASVIICVLVPLIVFGVVFYYSYWTGLKTYIEQLRAGRQN